MNGDLYESLKHTGKMEGQSASGLKYIIRPAKGVPFGQLVEIYREDSYLDAVRTFPDFQLWARKVGFEATI